MSTERGINLFALRDPKIKILDVTWFAFFLDSVVWFNHAPLLVFMIEAFDMTIQQVKALIDFNVTFTIPARIIIGILVYEFGLHKIDSDLLILSSFIFFIFVFAQNHEQLALLRFLMGFVIAVRMVGKWFAHKPADIAEGVYGDQGHLGSAAEVISLPKIALLMGGENVWRYAMSIIGIVADLYDGF